MDLEENGRFTGNDLRDGNLLVVADFMNGSSNVLEFAGALASRYNAHLELLQVVDPGLTQTHPNARAGARSNLERFAHRMRLLGTGVQNLLSFGSAEELIARRAAAIDARLVIFPLTGPATERSRRKLLSRLTKRCPCPVVAIPLEVADANPAELADAHRLRVLMQQLLGTRQKPVKITGSFGGGFERGFEAKPIPLLRGAR